VKGLHESRILEIWNPPAGTSPMPGESDDLREFVIKLFDETHVALQRYLIFLGLSLEDAEDAVQECFLRLHRHFDSRSDLTNVRGWLFQVAKNLARDRRKNAWIRRTSSSRDDEHLASIQDTNDTPETTLLKKEKLEWFRSAMACLTTQQVECLQLRASGLRYREIAAVMGIGISSVGELVQRAMIRLNEDSNEYGKGLREPR